jgi:PST family polysaccharide transporter
MIALLLNIDYLFTGHYLGAEALGVYTLAFRIPDMIITQFGVVINRVTFPAFVNIRDQEQSLSHGFEVALKFICAAILPTSAGIILVSDPFWRTFFPDTWLEAIPVMSIITVYTIFVTLVISSESVYKTMGKLRTMIKLYLLRLAIIAPALYFATTVIKTIEAVAWAQVGAAIILYLVNMVVTSRLVKIPYSRILEIMKPSMVSTLVMSIVVWGTLQFCRSFIPIGQIIVAIIVGLASYGLTLNWQDHSLVQESYTTFRRIFSFS